MRRGSIVRRVFGVAAVGAAVGASAASGQLPAPEAQVVGIDRPSAVQEYPTVDYGRSRMSSDDRTGTTQWRVINDTGNCCENYLTISKSGRLLDFGGSYVNYTDDRGLTWKSVRPIEPLVNGEGAIAMGPGGDVLGVEWDPYSGDHLLAFKYDAGAGKWFYNEMPLHQPFYDREWITVVPGPFTIDGQTVPYITFVKGGVPKELWLYSTDGLYYTHVSSKFLDRTLSEVREGTLPTVPTTDLDWMQPNSNGSATALGGARAFAAPDDGTSSTWSVFDGASLAWTGFRFPGGVDPKGRFQVDSLGRLHNLIPRAWGFTYRVSSDGGGTWQSLDLSLPDGHAIDQYDFRANTAVGVAAIAVHTHDGVLDVDRDLVYKLDIASKQPRLLRRYQVGLADVNSTAGVGNDIRFDFDTVAVFADGRIAVSFLDSTTQSPSGDIRPAVAIEGSTTLASATGGPPTKETAGTAQAPLQGTVTIASAGAGVRIGGVTSGYFVFDSLAGADNASMEVNATPSLPADVDLYLQQQLPDGTWSDDIADGTSGSLSGETMYAGTLSPGRYRVEAHEWAGPPGLQVKLSLTFFNSAGAAGG